MGQEGEVMPSRLTLLALALTLPLWPQAGDSGPSPIQIVTRTAAVDPSAVAGRNSSAIGLFVEIHNISAKNVLGYSLGVKFLDPSTAATFKGAGSHERMAAHASTPLHPGDCDCSHAKPIMIPKTPSGAVAEPQVALDLVVFDDGTTWGSGRLQSSQQLLKTLGVTLARR
jgi:hypothetical protein